MECAKECMLIDYVGSNFAGATQILTTYLEREAETRRSGPSFNRIPRTRIRLRSTEC